VILEALIPGRVQSHAGTAEVPPEELRERAVKMVFEVRDQDGKGRGELARGGPAVGCSPGGAADVGPAGGN
jgi:hypothetical protein